MTEPPSIPAGPPAPLPVQPLTYSVPWRTTRPGLLTAIGVISIVVGALSILSNASSIFQTVVFGVMSKVSTKMAATTTVTTSVTVTAGPPGASATTTSPTTVPAGLTQSEINGVIQRVQSDASNKLNAAQVATLRRELQDTSTPLVSQDYLYSPVLTADTDGDGLATVYFNGGGSIQIDSTGLMINKTAGNGLSGAAAWPFRISVGACVLTAVTGLLGLGLAVLLLVAGIMVLRHSPRARRLHHAFAIAKIPLALAAAGSEAWFQSQLFESMGPMAGPSPFPGQMLMYAHLIGWSVLGLAYPVGLLIALRARSVRDYYASVRIA